MKKPGLIIAAYPGMGQEIYTSIKDKYVHLSIYDYNRDNENWAKTYAEDAIDLVTKGDCPVCFVDTHKAVIKNLGELGFPFIIFYPGTPKENLIKSLALIYFRNTSIKTGKYLADVVLNFDDQIAELRLYPNSLASSTGIVNEEILNQLLTMDSNDRAIVIRNIGIMKTTSKEPKNQ